MSKIFNFDGELREKGSHVITEQNIANQNVKQSETADKLTNARTISLTGEGISGSATFDGSEDIEIKVSIESDAEKNQNAFSNVTVGDTTIEADNTTDTLTLEAGDNIELIADDENKKVTIKNTYSYEHPTGEGYEHLPAGNKDGQILKWESGVAQWTDVENVEISNATQEKPGLMSPEDKQKLDALENYEHPTVDVETHEDTTTPEFGATVDVVTDVTVDENGHTTSVKTTTVTIPNTKASSEKDGLMSKEDWSKLDDIEDTIDDKIGTHNTSTESHNDIRLLINGLSEKVNKFLDVDDETKDQLSEVITLIENNTDNLDDLTKDILRLSDIVDNLTTSATDKVLSANQGVVIKDLIDDLAALIEAHVETHAPDDAEKNQKAFSIVKVGETTVNAESTTDTLNLEAGDNIELIADGENKKVTIKNTYSYTHPDVEKTSDTDTATPEFGGVVDVITEVGTDDQGHTTSVKTTTVTIPNTKASSDNDGLMSKEAWTKLDGIEEGANKTIIDAEINSESSNPVQNKVINTALEEIRADVATKAAVRIITWEDDE